MRRIFLWIVILGVPLIWLTCANYHWGYKCWIEGTVVDAATEQKIDGVRVSLRKAGRGSPKSKPLDVAESNPFHLELFGLRSTKPPKVVVEVERPGYETATQSVSFEQRHQTVTLSIRMKKRPDGSPAPAP